jgi:hypothetical protein
MKIPMGGGLDAIHRVLFAHCFRVVWVNVATKVVGTHGLAVANGFDWLDGWWRSKGASQAAGAKRTMRQARLE